MAVRTDQILNSYGLGTCLEDITKHRVFKRQIWVIGLMKYTNFNMWLFDQRKIGGSRGDLALSAYKEYEKGEWPEKGTMQHYIDHLRKNGADDVVLKALEDVWLEYVDNLTKNIAQILLFDEIYAVVVAWLDSTEFVEDSGYSMDDNTFSLLKRLMQKLNK